MMVTLLFLKSLPFSYYAPAVLRTHTQVCGSVSYDKKIYLANVGQSRVSLCVGQTGQG